MYIYTYLHIFHSVLAKKKYIYIHICKYEWSFFMNSWNVDPAGNCSAKNITTCLHVIYTRRNNRFLYEIYMYILYV